MGHKELEPLKTYAATCTLEQTCHLQPATCNLHLQPATCNLHLATCYFSPYFCTWQQTPILPATSLTGSLVKASHSMMYC
jgi:hypothetical protein